MTGNGNPVGRNHWRGFGFHPRGARQRQLPPEVIHFQYKDFSNVANANKRKGDSGEREIAKILSDLLGFTVRRKLGAGRLDDTGDLDGLPDCTAQVKNWSDVARAIREGLPALAAQQQNAGTTHGVLFIRRRGGGWVAVMSADQWATLYREGL